VAFSDIPYKNPSRTSSLSNKKTLHFQAAREPRHRRCCCDVHKNRHQKKNSRCTWSTNAPRASSIRPRAFTFPTTLSQIRRSASGIKTNARQCDGLVCLARCEIDVSTICLFVGFFSYFLSL